MKTRTNRPSGSPHGGPRFHRQIRLQRWSTLNLSRGGVSLTLGRRGLKLNVGRRGVFLTVGMPGTGFSYRWVLTWNWLKYAWMKRMDQEGKFK